MANIAYSDIIARVRSLSSEPNSSGRWDDDDIMLHAYDACYQVSLRVDWPEATLTTTTQNGVQEYTLPPIIAILRVYCAGQILPVTSIDVLEGDDIQLYEQWGVTYSPQWTQISSTNAYPVPNWNFGIADDVMYYSNQRPKVYLRGGNIGLVYPPDGGDYTIQVDCIPEPLPSNNDSATVTLYPWVFMDAIVFNTLSRLYLADENDQKATLYDQKYEAALRPCTTWKRNLVRNRPRKAILYPYRMIYYSRNRYS